MKDLLLTFAATFLIGIAIGIQEFRTDNWINWILVIQIVLIATGINVYKYLVK